jgi:hypothetical protein
MLLIVYVGQASLQIHSVWIVDRQRSDGNKNATGAVLELYLVAQRRVRDRRADRERALWRHRAAGAFAPLVLYAHASRFAYGYLAWLCAVYLGTAIAGVLHQPVLALQTRRLYTLWFVLHLAGATALVVLGAYHVVIALQYE